MRAREPAATEDRRVVIVGEHNQFTHSGRVASNRASRNRSQNGCQQCDGGAAAQ